MHIWKQPRVTAVSLTPPTPNTSCGAYGIYLAAPRPDQSEVNILRGLLNALQSAKRRRSPGKD